MPTDTDTTRALADAIEEAAPGLRRFLELWVGQLDPERIQQLHAWLSGGLRIGVAWAAPDVHVIAIDAAGGIRSLQRVEIRQPMH